MKNKLLIVLSIALMLLLVATLASAYVPNRAPYAGGIAYGYTSYGSYPVNPNTYGTMFNYQNPVRVGGWFGQNSAYITGLRPGFYDSPRMNYWTRTRIASNYYPRAGGWFGSGYGNYYGLRSGAYYGGSYTGYGGMNSYYHGAW